MKILHPSTFLVCCGILLLNLTSCSKDDDGGNQDPFYGGALTSASAEMLEGTWSIFEAEFKDRKIPIPQVNQNCSRDFFMYGQNRNYTEYIFQDNNECIPEIGSAKWELSDGIITLSQSISVREEYVVTELTGQRLVFNAKADVDEDGKLDVISLTCRKYTPPVEMDLYSYTFSAIVPEDGAQKIRFSWRTYQGYNNFNRYEIYRGKTQDDISKANLVRTITDQGQSFFVDESPDPDKSFYFIKIYTDKGLLGESDGRTFPVDQLYNPSLELDTPKVMGQNIDLNWSKYQGSYFSHYEILVKNYEGGTGAFYEEETIKVIDDINETHYLDKSPPFMVNPVYTIIAVDIFGNHSDEVSSFNESTKKIDFKRAGTLDFEKVDQLALDPEENVVYIYGQSSYGAPLMLQRYNYVKKEIEASAVELPELYTSSRMKIVKSANGSELLFPQGNELYAYDAADLSLKYKIGFKDIFYFAIEDFEKINDDYWIFTDTDNIAIFKRNGSQFIETDRKPHFVESYGSTGYTLSRVDANHILVGHRPSPTSALFEFDEKGKLKGMQQVTLSIDQDLEQRNFYNPATNKFYDLKNKTIHDPANLASFTTFQNPNYATGISNNGTLILGTENDPQHINDSDFTFTRKIQMYNINTGALEEKSTTGYPHVLFQNKSGQIISISSQFKQAQINDAEAANLFMELIE